MSAGPLRNRHGGLEVPQEKKHTHSRADLPEVSRNGIILPPLGEALAGSSSFVMHGSEAGQHNATTKKKRHGSGTPAAVDAQNLQGTSKGDTVVISRAVTATSLHGDSPGDADDDGGITTAERKGQRGYFSRSDDDKHRGATEHGNNPAAGAKDATSNGLFGREMEEEKEEKADDESGGIIGLNISGRAQRPNGGGEGRGQGSVSPVAAMKARVDDALRNLLTLGSEAQVSPALASPPRTATGRNRRPDQPGTRGLSPLSWSRLKPGRRRKEPVFFSSSLDKGLCDGDSGSKQKPCLNDNKGPAANGGLPNTTSENVDVPAFDDEMANRNQREDKQPGVAEATASRGLMVGSEAGTGGCQKKASETDENHHDGNVGYRKAATGGEGMAAEEKVTSDLNRGASASPDRIETTPKATAAAAAAEPPPRVLARDNTLVPRDEWPELLDNEADPHEWALDKGEGEVLAAARRMGSVLVRVVTWNLHAKPTPAADKLREALLPPGKVIGYCLPRWGPTLSVVVAYMSRVLRKGAFSPASIYTMHSLMHHILCVPSSFIWVNTPVVVGPP